MGLFREQGRSQIGFGDETKTGFEIRFIGEVIRDLICVDVRLRPDNASIVTHERSFRNRFARVTLDQLFSLTLPILGRNIDRVPRIKTLQ